MRISLLDRLLGTEIGMSFGFGLAFFSTLFIMNHAFYLARLAISQGMPFRIALQLFMYKVPFMVAFCAPMGVLLATVLGVGRMTDHHEIAALRVCGTSLYRIAAPVVFLGAAGALGILLFSEGVVTAANERYASIYTQFTTKGPELQPVENVFFQGPGADGDALYYARRFDPGTKRLDDVTVIYVRGRGALRIIKARQAAYRDAGNWTFHDGSVYVVDETQVVRTRFAAMDLNVPRTPEDLGAPAKNVADMSLRELAARAARERKEGVDPRNLITEFHNRIAAAASSVVFALVGLPLSLRPHRSGPSIGMGLSILVLFAYYAILIPSQLASEGRAIPPALGAWLPNLLLGAAGGALLVRAAR